MSSEAPGSGRHDGGGHFVFIVGPSGAGKDTLIRGARSALAGDGAFAFVRRVITREADGSEDNEAISAAEFEVRRRAGGFALTWEAHGLNYGVPADAMRHVALGRVVVCNGSRAAIADARRACGPVRVVLVTAPHDVLQERLRARGRDSDIAGRLARATPALDDADCDLVIGNDGAAEAGIATLCRYLRSLARPAGAADPA